MKEELTKALIEVLREDNPGKLPDELQQEAEAVMMYYEEIKRAELKALKELT